MNQQQVRAQMTVWWVLWAAFQAGIVMVYHTLSSATPQPPQTGLGGSSAWFAAIVPLAISAMIRWLVLPGVRIAQTALVLFIVGIAMAESTSFLGLFIFPAHSQDLFVLSVLGIFQFVPFFARRYFPNDS
jgi:hypothetical protein